VVEELDDRWLPVPPYNFHDDYIHKSFRTKSDAILYASQYKDPTVMNIYMDPGAYTCSRFFGIRKGVHPKTGVVTEWVVNSRSGANYLTYATKRFRPRGGIKPAYYPLLPGAEAAGPFPTWARAKQYTIDGIVAADETGPGGKSLIFSDPL
jgi:hypothetical protein